MNVLYIFLSKGALELRLTTTKYIIKGYLDMKGWIICSNSPLLPYLAL